MTPAFGWPFRLSTDLLGPLDPISIILVTDEDTDIIVQIAATGVSATTAASSTSTGVEFCVGKPRRYD